MKSQELITDVEYNSVDVDKINKFISSPLGMDVLSHYDTLSREFSFKYMVRAGDIYPDITTDDNIIVQGVIDGFYFDSNGDVVLFDYKTDRVITTSEDIANKYKAQLNHYAMALENILKKRVVDKYIYLFDTDETIKM